MSKTSVIRPRFPVEVQGRRGELVSYYVYFEGKNEHFNYLVTPAHSVQLFHADYRLPKSDSARSLFINEM